MLGDDDEGMGDAHWREHVAAGLGSMRLSPTTTAIVPLTT